MGKKRLRETETDKLMVGQTEHNYKDINYNRKKKPKQNILYNSGDQFRVTAQAQRPGCRMKGL